MYPFLPPLGLSVCLSLPLFPSLSLSLSLSLSPCLSLSTSLYLSLSLSHSLSSLPFFLVFIFSGFPSCAACLLFGLSLIKIISNTEVYSIYCISTTVCLAHHNIVIHSTKHSELCLPSFISFYCYYLLVLLYLWSVFLL